MINWKLEIVPTLSRTRDFVGGNWKFVLLLFAICFLLFVVSSPVLAAEEWYLLKGIECIGTGDCQINDILKVVVNVSKLILRWVGVLALIFFIVGGIMWMTSGGNPEQVKKGKSILVNTIIGLLIVFLSWQIVNIVICGLSQGKLQETCEIFGNEKWNIFPGEKEKKAKKECLINEDGSPKETWEEGCSHEVIKTVKRNLNLLNCECGEENEQYNTQMTSCVKKFQRANALPETGKFDLNTWNKLVPGINQPLPNSCLS